MLKKSAIALIAGALLVAVPEAYSDEQSSMSDAQHRKTMSGMHHPDQGDSVMKKDAEKKRTTMSDTQHRKTMGGMSHPDQGDGVIKNDAEKKRATMSDIRHRKTMGGMSHPEKE